MHIVRKALLVLITPIFTLLLFVTATDMGIMRVVNQPANVKQILADSGIYNGATNSLLDQAKQISNSGNGDNVPLSDPIIRSAANSTFTPQFLQTNTENVIDSTYRWLNGLTAVPDFKIDLSAAKNQFASSVSKAVEQKAESLPACTSADIPSSFEALSASCLPPGVTPAAAASEVEGNILGGKGFLDNPVITADTIKAPEKNCIRAPGQADCPQVSVFSNQLKNVPMQYQRAKKLPVALAVLTLLIALAIIFLSSTRRKGLKHVGIILLTIGLLMMAFAWGISNAVPKKVVPKISLDNAVLQTDVRKLVVDIATKVERNYWTFGGVYTALGVLSIGGAIMLGRGGNKNKPAPAEPKAAAPDAPAKQDQPKKDQPEDKEDKPAAPKAEAAAEKPADRPAKTVRKIEVK